MVVLVVSTTIDPASTGPASALLAMSGWQPGITFEGIKSFSNGDVRLLQHENSIIKEDHLENRWENISGETVDELIFLSRHTAVSNRPALTLHPIGVPHLKDGDKPPQGGRPGWAAPPNPRIASWLKLLKKISDSHGLIPEFEITLEATHHGPETNKPAMFVEIGSTEEHWGREDAARVIAQLLWEGLGLGGGTPIGNWSRNTDKNKVLLGIGGGHYVPRHMDIILKDDVWVGHLLSGYSLPMEDPTGKDTKDVGGTWKQAIKASYDATRTAFPGGNIMAHLDHKSFKGWQKNAITSYLSEEKIMIGKPNDFS
ncbi:D-aminoacyl-tRNA deacylase-like isoform X2 [Impatiens glandulifera]|uniref:D-aminoacyl-tRNA deacylase-like isoform X2 n=1 Tax=Impatiens glandulifera TaxID=253017 RepID=UPI001FB0CC40|nr:D-aminoacyl-tRNA deacylase-like isoform X2 [Impatiens glandulifera]